MKKDLQKIKEDILNQWAVGGIKEIESDRQLSEKVERILSTRMQGCDADEFKCIVDEIKSYMDCGEVQKSKLLSFCCDFYDPTMQVKSVNANGEEIQLHRFLNEDELTQVYQFVKRHSADITFDKTVYSIMVKHDMEPPEVYKNAMITRQDFSRVTEIGNASVTRRMAWQIIIGLHCDIEEADEVLFSAGYIRRNTKFDMTMEYFIKHKNYDIMAINEVLYELRLKVFSCHKPVSGK